MLSSLPPRARYHLSSSEQASRLASLRVVFVDDEAANCRLGLRMLTRTGVDKDNIVFLSNGPCSDLHLPCVLEDVGAGSAQRAVQNYLQSLV